MIDLHAHILFGVDDGAPDLNESIKMLESAANAGIHSVCLTPHVSPYRRNLSTQEEIQKAFEILKDKINEQHIDISLFLGAEIDEHESILKTLEHGHTLNNSKYVLVDFSRRDIDISEMVYELRIHGYKVVIAHPERTKFFNIELLKQLKREGALLQVSSPNLTGNIYRKVCKRARLLLKEDLIDVVASDAHSATDVSSMKSAYHYVVKKKGLRTAEKLFIENPRKIIGI
ncbi:MAG: hypothetical protein CVV57_08935 [Tenericutes bacterium HGW-Tenericutes-2]|jgi:protein-tyrosine phosphatase|nr:MAG: hypothetical protein CVV57_08935 [Tenericutes bacterium HGW-Tenericutes-2]